MSRLGIVLCLTATLIGACALAVVEDGRAAQSTLTPAALKTPVVTEVSLDPTPVESTPVPTLAAPTPDVPTPTPDLASLSWLRRTITSPSGAWTIVSGTARPEATPGLSTSDQLYEEITAQHSDGSRQWAVRARWVGLGLGASSPEQFFFSPDERYLYFTDEGYPDGCGPSGFFELWRFDLEAGQLEAAAPFTWGRLVVSPDAGLAAYGRLTWLDTATGITQTVEVGPDLPANWVGSALAWAPDGQSLLVSLNGGCDEAGSAVARVDVSTRAVTVLIHDPANRLSVQEWSQADRALLVDAQGLHSWLDPATGALTAPESPAP